MSTQKTPAPSVSILAKAPLAIVQKNTIAAPVATDGLTSKERSKLKFEAEKKARLAARAEKDKAGVSRAVAVEKTKLDEEAACTAKIKELGVKAEALKGADSLQAVLIRRELQKFIDMKRTIVAVRNEKQRGDRAQIKGAVGLKAIKTPQEVERYVAAQKRKAEREAAAQAALVIDAQRILDGQYFANVQL